MNKPQTKTFSTSWRLSFGRRENTWSPTPVLVENPSKVLNFGWLPTFSCSP